MKTKAVTFRMDAELKERTEEVMKEVGLNLTSAFTILCKAIVRDGGLPAELLVDKFYRAENRDEIVRRIKAKESGSTKDTQVIKTMKELEEIVYG